MTIALCVVIGVLVLEIIGLRVKIRRLERERRLCPHGKDTERYGPCGFCERGISPSVLGYTVTYADGRTGFVAIGKGGEC